MVSNRVKKIIFTLFIAMPSFAFAQQPSVLGKIIPLFTGIVQKLIPIAFGAGVIAFFWGLAKYMLDSGSEESKIEGKRIMVGGVIALFIMASIWGIVTFIAKDLGLPETKTMTVPRIGF